VPPKTKAKKLSNSTASAKTSSGARKVILLDGHSLAFRAFFALPETLVTASGQVTNAVFGFTSMLIKLMADEKPTAVLVCFDKGAPQFRLDKYKEYKAGRAETPEHFRQQMPLIREVLGALKIPLVELQGFEADDLLATITKRCRDHGDEVIVVTGDRDIIQLVREGVEVIMTRRGISDVIRYDEPTVAERYGVTPAQWLDFVALKGEAADNLPGVPGVGDKTAAQLVVKYGDIEQVIAHAGELTPKLKESLKAHADQVRINKDLGRLLDDVELPLDPTGLELQPWDDEEVRRVFTSLEFRTLHDRLKALNLHRVTAAPASAVELTIADLTDKKELTGEGATAIAWSDQWVALCNTEGKALTLPSSKAAAELADFLRDAKRPKVAHDAKPLFRNALKSSQEVAGLYCDTKVAAYLLEPGSPSGYSLEEAASRYLGMNLHPANTASPGEQTSLVFDSDDKQQAARQAVALHALAPKLEEQLRANGTWQLAVELEFPLVGVLARMEHAGILIDKAYLKELDEKLGKKSVELERAIQAHAGEQINVNSQPQLQKILFDKLKLPKTRKIKTGYSTDAGELEKLKGNHPIIDALLEYREVAKLKTGFTDMLLELIDKETGRIHTTYDQAIAATGRLSSTNPNLQNIPIRDELGRQIRRAFVAPPGHVLLSADYSQIELRVLAHLSQDETFLQAFHQGHDFHAAIASKVYNVPIAEVTPDQRSQVKQFSYGIAYGMSAFGVSQRLGIEVGAAAQFIEMYYAQFPKVKAFLNTQVDQAKIDGYTTTMFGRRRYLPELRSDNFRMRAIGERMALNTPIQGSAADILKRAMINVDRALHREPIAKMLLTVHDELVFEVPKENLKQAHSLIEEEMSTAAQLSCGLVVDIHVGNNWAEAHA